MCNTPSRVIPRPLIEMVEMDCRQAHKWGKLASLHDLLYGRLLVKELCRDVTSLEWLVNILESYEMAYAVEQLMLWTDWYQATGLDALEPSAQWFRMLTPREQQLRLDAWTQQTGTVL